MLHKWVARARQGAYPCRNPQGIFWIREWLNAGIVSNDLFAQHISSFTYMPIAQWYICSFSLPIWAQTLITSLLFYSLMWFRKFFYSVKHCQKTQGLWGLLCHFCWNRSWIVRWKQVSMQKTLWEPKLIGTCRGCLQIFWCRITF